MSLLCKHKWVVKGKIVLKSKFEILVRNGYSFNSSFDIINNYNKRDKKFLTQTGLVVVVCEKCGKIKSFKIVN